MRIIATSMIVLILLGSPSLLASADDGTAGLERFLAGLEEGGYSATIDPTPVLHPNLSITGVRITADKFGAEATVELLAYASKAELEQDWDAVDQSPPRPRRSTNEFAGKVLIWREDSVLVLDFHPPNDLGTAQTVALIFLGRRNISFEGVKPGIIPPGTGSGGLAESFDVMELLIPDEIPCGQTVTIKALNSPAPEVIFLIFQELGRSPTGLFVLPQGGREGSTMARDKEVITKFPGGIVPSRDGIATITYEAPIVDRDVHLSIEAMGYRDGRTVGGSARGLTVRACSILPPTTGNAGFRKQHSGMGSESMSITPELTKR
jgi:hypothetical protein